MEDKAFSSIDFVGQCLLDPEKASSFQRAIKRVVKSTHVVLDVGTGSGILALFSAVAGAKKVVALEFDPFVANIAKQNFRNNGYEKVITTMIGDARNFKFSSSTVFDVVSMEMLTSGMIDEMQVQAINNLHTQGVVSSKTKFIPYRQDTYITLADVNFRLFGLNMKMIIHAWKYFKKFKKGDLSKKVLLNSIIFSQVNKESFTALLRVKIIKDGTINALWLSSQAFVSGNVFLESTPSLNPPVAIPVPDKKVHKGDEVDVHISYKFGHGYQNFVAKIT